MAIVTLAVGLGANIAAFSAFDAVLVRNFPVEKPEELVTFDWLIAGLLFAVSPADPLSLAAAVFVLITAATVAAVRPAQRAARLNVTDALRHD